MNSIQDFIGPKEDLCMELKDFLYTQKDGPLKGAQFINHPLYCCPLHFPELNRHANAAFRAKSKSFGSMVASGDWSAAIACMVEKPYRIQYISEYTHRIPEAEYWPILASVWMSVENLWQYNPQIRGLFRGRKTTIWETFESEKSKAEFQALPDEIEVFRGCKFHNQFGWSWTLSFETARWFASRFPLGDQNTELAHVRRAVIPKSEALCYFVGRNEKEIVVDPRTIKNVESMRVDTL